MKRSAVHSINNKSFDGAADIKFQNTPKIVNYQSRSSLLIERSSGAATELKSSPDIHQIFALVWN